MTIIEELHINGFKIGWVNAISKFGYLTIYYEPGVSGDFPSMWLLADQIGQFLRTCNICKAEGIAYHYYECGDKPKQLFIIPRYENEYEDHNEVYNLSESNEQPETTSKTLVKPLIPKLFEYVNTNS